MKRHSFSNQDNFYWRRQHLGYTMSTAWGATPIAFISSTIGINTPAHHVYDITAVDPIYIFLKTHYP